MVVAVSWVSIWDVAVVPVATNFSSLLVARPRISIPLASFTISRKNFACIIKSQVTGLTFSICFYELSVVASSIFHVEKDFLVVVLHLGLTNPPDHSFHLWDTEVWQIDKLHLYIRDHESPSSEQANALLMWTFFFKNILNLLVNNILIFISDGILYQKPLTPFVMEMKAIC